MKSMKRRREYDDDDGRTIAPMDIDGMPGYNRHAKRLKEENGGQIPELSKEEMRIVYWAAIKAGLLIVLVIGGAAALLIFLLLKLWS